jgi:ubiquinol oxidase
VLEHGVPGNVLKMGYTNLKRESLAIVNSVFPRHFPLPGSDELLRKLELTKETRAKLNRLELSNDAIWDREKKRHEEGGEVYAPWLIKVPYYLLCYMLDGIFDGRPIPRFWFLETVARTPYFSYSTM